MEYLEDASMFIYITTNKINGKKYIGMCTRDNNQYLGSGKLLKQAINKYGKDNFTREIIERCDDFEDLCEKEKYWIDYYDAVSSSEFYNLIEGGIGGNAESLKQYWQSMTSEERKNIRNWKPHFKLNPLKGDKNPMYGKSTSEYVKKAWADRTTTRKKEIAEKVSRTRKEQGTAAGSKNPMYGRSAIRENNLRWYTNGERTIYVTENTQPSGFVKGRKLK